MTEMPAPSRPSSSAGARFSLLPELKPPPWMYTTSGVGRSALAFQRSSTLRSWGPYFTPARSGAGFSACLALAFSWAGAWARRVVGRPRPSVQSRNARRTLSRFMGGPWSDGVRINALALPVACRVGQPPQAAQPTVQGGGLRRLRRLAHPT